MEDTRTIWSRVIKLVGFAVAGAVLVILSALVKVSTTWETTWQIISATVGSTFVVIFGLGVTVDWWMKKGILDDVVKASLGYMIPPDLRPAMRWVYTQHIICTRHEQTTEIIPTSDPRIVIMKTQILRVLENVGETNETIDLKLEVDDWLEPSFPSDILKFAYHVGKHEDVDVTAQKVRTSDAVRIKETKVRVGKGEPITISSVFQEAKRATDITYGVFSYPTKNPHVTFKAPNDFQITSYFTVGHDDRGATRYLGKDEVILEGTMLPLQPIVVRWSEKNKPQLVNGGIKDAHQTARESAEAINQENQEAAREGHNQEAV